MLSRISSESLTSISNKYNYKTFLKSPPASLLHCIGNILSHSSGRWRDSLTMASLSFTNGCSEFHLCKIFINLGASLSAEVSGYVCLQFVVYASLNLDRLAFSCKQRFQFISIAPDKATVT